MMVKESLKNMYLTYLTGSGIPAEGITQLDSWPSNKNALIFIQENIIC